MPKPSSQPVYVDTTRPFRLGDAVCDLRNNQIVMSGKTQRLEPRLTGVLDLLARRNGEAVTRDELLDVAWDGSGTDEAINQAISRLRRLLGRADLIETLPRIGYRLTEPVEGVSDAHMRKAPHNSAMKALLARFQRHRAFLLGFGSGALVTAALVLAILPREQIRDIELIVGDPGMISPGMIAAGLGDTD